MNLVEAPIKVEKKIIEEKPKRKKPVVRSEVNRIAAPINLPLPIPKVVAPSTIRKPVIKKTGGNKTYTRKLVRKKN